MAQKRIPWYANGSCPTSRLIVIKRGRNDSDGAWEHRLPRATLRRWRHLQDLGKNRSGGRVLEISDGWSTDRPVEVQERLKKLLGKYAATPRTSSHGMVFEGKQTAAIDVGNWWWVYQNCGGYNAWQEDARAAGFTRLPDGYQQEGEYHHIIDWNPWDDEPEFGGAPAGTVTPIEEDDMYDDDAKKKAAERHTELMAALEKVHRAAAPFKVLSWGTGLVVYNPLNGKLWILPEGYSDLLAAIGLVGGNPFRASTEQLGFATGFLPSAIGEHGDVDGFTAADLDEIKKAIAQSQVAVTPEQLKKLTDAVGAAARAGGEEGAVQALKDLTFVVSAA